MLRSDILTSLIKAVAVTVLITAGSVLIAATITVLASWSKELITVVMIAGVATAAGLVAVATLDDRPPWQP